MLIGRDLSARVFGQFHHFMHKARVPLAKSKVQASSVFPASDKKDIWSMMMDDHEGLV